MDGINTTAFYHLWIVSEIKIVKILKKDLQI